MQYVLMTWSHALYISYCKRETSSKFLKRETSPTTHESFMDIAEYTDTCETPYHIHA